MDTLSKTLLIKKLDEVEQIAQLSKANRFLKNPWKYLKAVGHRKLFFSNSKKPISAKTNTFFGYPMHLSLPSGTDIYLTGGKSHDSEIRLARLMIKYLNEGDCFMDIGAHFGYFSLLAGHLVGTNGEILAFEASPQSFQILEKNTSSYKQIAIINKAVAQKEGILPFYEFPNLYSEYNSFDISPFEKEAWFQQNQPNQIEISSVPLDSFINKKPKMIKIDVEGAEFEVVKGAERLLQQQNFILIMEYLSSNRGNEAHRKAVDLLIKEGGFLCYSINQEGGLSLCKNPDNYLKDKQLDSDNLVFTKNTDLV